MSPEREVRALARALGCGRRQIVEALQAHQLWPTETRPTPRLERPATAARFDRPAAPRPKQQPVRSEAYRRLVAARPCISCGIHGYSQAAHANHGKGLGIKTDDRMTMPLCSAAGNGCHALFDRYELLPGGRRAHIEAARRWAAETRRGILAEGLWPAGVPLMEEDEQ